MIIILFALGRYMIHGGIKTLLDSVSKAGKWDEASSETVALIGGTGGTVAALLLLFGQMRSLFKSPASLEKAANLFTKPNYSSKLPLIHKVTHDFQSLVRAYAGDQDVFVFIDDLDRCDYTKAAEVMQALLTLLSSAPQIVLILGVDRGKVAAALAAKQEKLLPYLYRVTPTELYARGIEYGQRFLEKFIQVSFILPLPQLRGLEAMVNPSVQPPEYPPSDSATSHRVMEILSGKDDSETLNQIIELAGIVFDCNPRNIKQFVNMFRLQAFIANEVGLFRSLRATKASGTPLTIPQLSKYVALCMRWPDFVKTALELPSLISQLETYLVRHPFLDDRPIHLECWLREHSLMALFSYRLDVASFQLSGVDLRVLNQVSPARHSDFGKDRELSDDPPFSQWHESIPA